MSETRHCLKCKWLYAKADGTGFVTYYCARTPELVVGEKMSSSDPIIRPFCKGRLYEPLLEKYCRT